MIAALLVDLDGTLIDFDPERFMSSYFNALGAFLELENPKPFFASLLDSIEKMIADQRDISNEEKFWSYFYPHVDYFDKDYLLAKLEEFYQTKFDEVKKHIIARPTMKKALDLARKKGLTTILSTNAIFPLTAIIKRLVWGGYDPQQFSYISDYQKAHFAKPNPRFFLEIADKQKLKIEECLVVGNDESEDLSASLVGFKTFLVNDSLIKRADGYPPTYTGTQKDFYNFIKNLPKPLNGQNNVEITTPYITLGQFLKLSNLISSGAEAKSFLQFTKVWINGVLDDRRGRKLYDGDEIKIKAISYKIYAHQQN
jgi:ribosome-associated protein YbcJ (S4-like RNA binding protein)/FMN phosphatase YigB (HAD superfamily)